MRKDIASPALVAAEHPALAQTAFNSGEVSGTVTDQTGALISAATVTISNPVSGTTRTKATDENGASVIRDVPFNHYHLNDNGTRI